MTTESLGLDLSSPEEEPLDVLDLPQLYSRPDANALLSVLSDLKSQPPSWDTTPNSSRNASGAATPARRQRKIRNQGVPAYLTKIVSSSLQWILDDAQKEEIWDAASQELSARSGRTAVGDMTRSFFIPLVDSGEGLPAMQVTNEEDCIELVVHEPALTSDNLGFKTWASSFMLAKRLCLHKDFRPERILELGSGTGLVGMTAASAFRTHVLLTDLPEIVPNLERNMHANAAAVRDHGGTLTVSILDWSAPHKLQDVEAQSFDMIVAADVAYDLKHPPLLAKTIAYHLIKSKNARVIIEVPLREGFDLEMDTLRREFDSIGLDIAAEGREVGLDDWSQNDDDGQMEITCWWSIWQWKM